MRSISVTSAIPARSLRLADNGQHDYGAETSQGSAGSNEMEAALVAFSIPSAQSRSRNIVVRLYYWHPRVAAT